MRLRPLTIHDAVKDFDVVMTSRAEISELFDIGGSHTFTAQTLNGDEVVALV